MYKTENIILKENDAQYKAIMSYCILSKNLYNKALSEKMHYYKNDGFNISKFDHVKKMRKDNDVDFYALPSKIAAGTVHQLHNDFNSFFQLLKSRNKSNINKKISMPAEKKNYAPLYIEKQCINKTIKIDETLFEHTICKQSWNIKIISRIENINHVIILPFENYIRINLIYKVEESIVRKNNNYYASIDLGVNNLVAFVNNKNQESFIYKGGHIKSINRYYNKEIKKMKTKLNIQNLTTSKSMNRLNFKRKEKISWFLHNISKHIVNYLVENDINTLIIGYNKAWKQNVNIGSKNNQNFHYIPYHILLKQLEYKCKNAGINFITTEESYTSKASAIDKDDMNFNTMFGGKRINRGIYQSKEGIIINADINAAINIMRKVVPDEQVFAQGILDGAVHPITIKF